LTSTAPRVLVTNVRPEEIHQAVTVLCDAFQDYPVMRYVLGSADDYDHRLRTLIGFFVSARVLREEPVLGIYDGDGTLAAAALVTLPLRAVRRGVTPPPPEHDRRPAFACGSRARTEAARGGPPAVRRR
jgi:hypothetical protein